MKGVSYRAWRNVKRDLHEAAGARDMALKICCANYVANGKVNPALARKVEETEAAYWRIDREARKYKAFTK